MGWGRVSSGGRTRESGETRYDPSACLACGWTTMWQREVRCPLSREGKMGEEGGTEGDREASSPACLSAVPLTCLARACKSKLGRQRS